MSPWYLIGFYVLFSMFLSAIIGFDAQRRGLKKEDVIGWTVLAFIFSIFALILYLVVIVPKPVLRAYCPRCEKLIQIEWRTCPYCGQELKKRLY